MEKKQIPKTKSVKKVIEFIESIRSYELENRKTIQEADKYIKGIVTGRILVCEELLEMIYKGGQNVRRDD